MSLFKFIQGGFENPDMLAATDKVHAHKRGRQQQIGHFRRIFSLCQCLFCMLKQHRDDERIRLV